MLRPAWNWIALRAIAHLLLQQMQQGYQELVAPVGRGWVIR